jgi:hypothetical protein
MKIESLDMSWRLVRMKQTARIIVGCLCLLVCSALPSLAKEWRGIIPLHSTRADVLKLLGNPKHDKSDNREYFDLDNEKVIFGWIDSTCARKYPVSPDNTIGFEDLVLKISVIPKVPLKLDDLHLGWKIFSMNCLGDDCSAWSEEDGFGYYLRRAKVIELRYGPSAAEFEAWQQEHKTCVSSG